MSVRNTKADRRSQRTRQLLSAALIELMLEKRYDDISVQDIIERANVGRSTFYAHYLDKEDLLVGDFTRVLDALSH
jgi:AcrR family transcriptional regulator